MNISKVKLKDSKGITVNFLRQETVNDLTFLNEYVGNYRMPVHQGMKDLFNKLKPHLIKVCGLAVIESDIEITAIQSNGDSFLISGKVSVLNGQVYAINTPLIKEEAEYSQHGNVLTIVDEIYKETKMYCDKKRKVDVKQFAMDFNRGKEGYVQEDFDKMSEGEARELMVAALEKSGAIIIDREDMEEDNGRVIDINQPEKEVKKKAATV